MRHIGVSNFSVEQPSRAQAIAPVETLQPPYSLIDREVEDEILPFAAREGIGVIVYSPMASGLLERLKAVARRHDTTVGAVAVAWTLRNPAVDGAIVGFRRPDQVDPIVGAANVELSEDDLETIERSA